MSISPGLDSYPELKKVLNAPPGLLLRYSVFRNNSSGGQSQTLIIAIPQPDSIVVGKTYSLPHPGFLLFYDASALDMRADMNKIGPSDMKGTLKVLSYHPGRSIKLEFDVNGQTADKTAVFLKAKRAFKPLKY